MDDADSPTVNLTMTQIAVALSDYCGKHGLVPTGSYRIQLTTATIDGQIDHMRLRFVPITPT